MDILVHTDGEETISRSDEPERDDIVCSTFSPFSKVRDTVFDQGFVFYLSPKVLSI